jgi:hypothetical protein
VAAAELRGSPWPLNGFDAALVAQTYDGRPMTTHHVLEIDRPLDPDRVRSATEQLVELYPELCSRVELGPRLRRFVLPPDRARVRAAVQCDGDGSFAALEGWMARPIPVERAYPFAIRLAPGQAAAQALTLSLHHSLTDGQGALALLGALLELLQSRRPRARAVRLASEIPPQRLPWSHALRRLAMLFLRPAAALVDAAVGDRAGHRIMVLPIPGDVWQALGRRAHRCGVTRTTLSWHAAARAVSAMPGHNGASPRIRIRILGPVDLRGELGVPGDALQNWLGTVEHDVDPAIDVCDLHAQLRLGREHHRALVTPLVVGALAERLPPRIARAVFRLIDSQRWPTPHTLMLTHLRPPASTCWPTALQPRRLWCTSLLPRKPAIGLTVTSVDDVVTAVASWHAAALRRRTVDDFLHRWLGFLAEER